MKVVFDVKENLYLCNGHGFLFKAWFAGQKEKQVVEAEIIDSSGEVIDVINMPAPEPAIPTTDEVAAAFSPKLKALREQLKSEPNQ